jgi:hypothetical protein
MQEIPCSELAYWMTEIELQDRQEGTKSLLKGQELMIAQVWLVCQE